MANSTGLPLSISCLCGSSKQTVFTAGNLGSQDGGAILCHCDSCRYSTGLLCTSYLRIAAPKPAALETLIEYASPSARSSRWFCGTCGCHVFQALGATGSSTSAQVWQVATGVIIGPSRTEQPLPEGALGASPGWRHQHIQDTKDGGISIWLGGQETQATTAQVHPSGSVAPVEPPRDETETLAASCLCSNVRFSITRPDESSTLARSTFPDLMLAYCRTPKETLANAGDTKWWLQACGTKYLAGTCACRSCRLISGFEIQTWAFIPRSNMSFHVPSPSAGAATPLALDFATLPPGILQSYESSPGVVREFCPRCGATVFWHDRWRPDLVDVSVGLLRAPEGARAERWLRWWTDRVSFAEDTETQRHGEVARWARRLVDGLAEGLRAQGGRGRDGVVPSMLRTAGSQASCV